MSAQEDKLLVDIVKDKLLSVIQPQILQLTNIYLVQLVNTGDRVKDGCLIVVLNALIALCMSALYFIWTFIYNLCKSKQDVQMNVVEIMKNIKVDDINKFIHRSDIKYPILFETINEYLIEEKIIDDFYSNKNIQYYTVTEYQSDEYGNTSNTLINRTKTYIHPCSENHVIIPVYRYMLKNSSTYKYVFYRDGELLSETYTGLSEITDILIKYACNKMHISCSKKNKQYLFYELQQRNDDICVKRKGNILKDCVFDSIHFEKKTELLEWVNKFKENRMYPKGLSMSNKLGILLHGPPGTGKTGCISALANYLGRNILMINSLNLCDTSKDKLDDFIRANRKEYIYVFDEFDYLLSDKSPKKNSKMAEYRDMLLYADADERKQIMEEMKKGPNNNFGPVDQAFLLKMLDGVGENDGRIIIATTNYPEKINPLFLRPGRFDVKLELGYCTYEMFVNICLVKFEDIKNPEYKERIEKILLKNITPLILINTLVIQPSIEELFEKLEQQEQEKSDQN